MSKWIDVPGMEGIVKINNQRQFLILSRKIPGNARRTKERIIDIDSTKSVSINRVRITVNGEFKYLNYNKLSKELFGKVAKKKEFKEENQLLEKIREKFKINNESLKKVELWELDFYAESMKIKPITIATAISNVLHGGGLLNAR